MGFSVLCFNISIKKSVVTCSFHFRLHDRFKVKRTYRKDQYKQIYSSKVQDGKLGLIHPSPQATSLSNALSLKTTKNKSVSLAPSPLVLPTCQKGRTGGRKGRIPHCNHQVEQSCQSVFYTQNLSVCRHAQEGSFDLDLFLILLL